MKLSRISLILISFHVLLILGKAQKCCRSGQHIVEKNSVFTCEDLVNARLQENFEHRDFLVRNVTGTCSDIVSGKNLAKFSVNAEGKIVKISDHGDLYFPKCCPPDYRYNATTHGCEKEAGNVLEILKINSFIRVGLPGCKIVSDQILDSVHEVEMNGKDLNLLKEGKILREDFCVDSTSDGKLAVRKCEDDIDICSRRKCVLKCCPDGQSFIDGAHCRDTFVHGVNLHFTKIIADPDGEKKFVGDSDDPFVLVHGFRSPMYISHSVDDNGTLRPKPGIFVDNASYFQASNVAYCMEHVFSDGRKMDAFYVFTQKIEPHRFNGNRLLTGWLKMVSCIFFILTILIYLFLPQLRNLSGKVLLSYCVSTFLYFFLRLLYQFDYENYIRGTFKCKFMGFGTVLTKIWSFTWLHIMCIDIWFSYGSKPRTMSGQQTKKLESLLQYSLYGWLFPVLWVLMIGLFNYTDVLPAFIQPFIGEQACHLENSQIRPGNYAYHLFVTLPIILQQIVNTILFIKTILYCLNNNDSDRRTALNTREKLGLMIKLAVTMGVFFLFESISSIYDFKQHKVTKYIEIVFDSINCLQGLFIFIIFICKKKVIDSICDKIPMLRNSKTSVSSSIASDAGIRSINGFQREKIPEESSKMIT